MSDIITRDENGDLAVRTVAATESDTQSQYDDLYTRTTDGKRALRVVGIGVPDPTGNELKFLRVSSSGELIWSDKALVNNTAYNYGLAIGTGAEGYINAVAVGFGAKANHGTNSVAIGSYAEAGKTGNGQIAIGGHAKALADSAIQIGVGTNSVIGSLQIRNYTLMNRNGTIPPERLAADGMAGQVLTKTDDGAAWTEPTGGAKITLTTFGD